MVRSCESLFTAMFAAGMGAIAAGDEVAAVAGDEFAAGDVAAPGVAGAVTAGGFACGDRAGGLGPKYFAQRMITPNERSDAARIRNSGVNLSFCPGALMSAPWGAKLLVHSHSSASLPISPVPGRNQICARADGSAAAVSIPAKSRVSRQIAQSPRRHNANTSARSGSFPRTEWTGKTCRIAEQAGPSSPANAAGSMGARYIVPLLVRVRRALQQAQQIRRQRRKLRACHRTLRVNDDVPS